MMTTTTRLTTGTLIALTTLLGAAGALEAQTSGDRVSGDDPTERVERLQREAERASRDLGSFGEARSLYHEAARLLGDHPDTAWNLVQAGRLAHYTGDDGLAIRHFKDAGEAALEWGDVLTAAQSFLDAAWLAARKDRDREAVRLVDRAAKLSSSPLISSEDREALLSRVSDITG